MTRVGIMALVLLLAAQVSAQTTVHEASVTLTHSDIVSLPTMPVAIAGAPGVGKAIVVLEAVLRVDVSQGEYTNVDDLAGLKVYSAAGGEQTLPLTRLILTTPWRWFGRVGSAGDRLDGTFDDLDLFENSGLVLGVTNQHTGNFSGGHPDNTLTITVYYLLVDL